MRILICHNYYARRSGECNVVEREIELLSERGHEVSTFTYDNATWSDRGLPSRWSAARNAIDSPETERDLQALLAHGPFDVAHVHNTWFRMSPAVYRTLWLGGLPVVKTVHNYRWLCPVGTFFRDGHVCEDCISRVGGPLRAIAHRCFRQSTSGSAVAAARVLLHRDLLRTWHKYIDVIVVQTEFVRAKLIANGFPADRMVVKGNFIKRPSIEATPTRNGPMVFFGRLEPTKGLDTLLTALQRSGTRVRIFGKGPLSDWVRDEVRLRFGNSGQVDFAGFVPDEELFRAIASAAAVVFPSEWYESYPLAIVEAMSLGTPVIASRLGSIPYVVRDGENGLLFTPGDADSLAGVMLRLSTDPALRAALGTGALKTYDREMSPEKNYESLIAIYERAMIDHRERHV